MSVGRAEEQSLVYAAAADVEGRANVLLHQLEDADRHSVGRFISFCFVLSLYVSFLIVGGISCVRGDHGAARSPSYGRCLPRLPGVAPGPKKDQLWAARRRVTTTIESGVRRSTGVSLAMAELSVGADLTGIEGFPTEELLRLHEDLVARYGPANEAVATLVPAQRILVELPRDAAP
jgi:hypothetical protein